jgi:hypothetical protein
MLSTQERWGMRRFFSGALAWALVVVTACGDDGGKNSDDAGSAEGDGDAGAADDATDGTEPSGYRSAVYDLDKNWLCNPKASTPKSDCLAPSATEIASDNTLHAAPVPTASTKLDCFYVYPTLDVVSPAGRVKDYANIEDIWEVARQQALPFAESCRIYAPLYHQVTINSYLDPERETLLSAAYAEVDDAFRHYLAQYNQGRDIVFIGHSQGTHMLRRLLQHHFDGPENRTLRAQLASALLIGDIGDVAVPRGARVGGTFQDIPLCAELGERGCLIAYNSFPPSAPPNPLFGLYVGGIPDGLEPACTNPASLGKVEKAVSAGAYFPSDPKATARGAVASLKDRLGVSTYFSVLPAFYSLECQKTATGTRYLQVAPIVTNQDMRSDPVQYDSQELSVSLVGLHTFDFNLTLGDLRAFVRALAK